MSSFVLDPQLEADTLALGEFDLCRLQLMNDARFPWLILIPQKPGLVELIDLAKPDRDQLFDEIAALSEGLKRIFQPDKINVAALGNQVRQLHVHVIARFVSDVAWPKPVWGVGERTWYPAHSAGALAAQIAGGLARHGLKDT
jgi:diadenosine tetraphosphate (Ap4A) HIT family hydrolase